jgi:hypothetical protein
MSKKHKKEEIIFKTSNLNEKDGININYDKEELIEKLPNLMSEITYKENVLKIEAVDSEFEQDINLDNEFTYCEDLSNPGALDFIRRCKNKEEALNILNYLLNRKEISENDHSLIMNKINEKDGLKRLIQQCGGYKTPGYYLKKYYNDERIINDYNSNND